MIYMDLTGYKLYLLAIFEIKTQYVFDFLITMLTTLFAKEIDRLNSLDQCIKLLQLSLFMLENWNSS